MYDKSNIMKIIADHQEDIDKIEREIQRAKDMGLNIPDVIAAAENKLSYLYDNKARFEMQAKAWGLM